MTDPRSGGTPAAAPTYAQRIVAFVMELAAESDPDDWQPYDQFGDPVDTDTGNNGDVRDHGAREARWEIAKRARAILREMAAVEAGALSGASSEPSEAALDVLGAEVASLREASQRVIDECASGTSGHGAPSLGAIAKLRAVLAPASREPPK